MVGWLRALLFVVGGVAAAGGTAYYTGLLDPMLGRQPQVVASLPQGAQQPVQEQAPAATEEEAVPLPEDEPKVTEKQDRVVAPSFELLRVEPDGSLLVAGKAGGEATVEVLSDDEVLVSTKAEPSGDFVAVLDEPLAPGDYQLSLRATIDGAEPTVSAQTAIVSVPETADGQVLAMIEAPGQAAELITVPQSPAAPEPEASADEPVAVEEAEAPQEPSADERQTGQETDEPAATEVPSTAEAPVQEPSSEQPADAPAGTEIAAASDEQAESEDEGQVAAADQTVEPEVEVEVVTEQPEASGGQSSDEAATEAEANQPASVVDAPAQAVDTTVVVEAVEIEGDTIFVAGQAAPGRTVRVYANDILIGDARASEGGRFLVEERRELPVGSYTIRADLLDESGAVLARAAVPFEREEGEAIAAVAPQPQGTQQPSQTAEDTAAKDDETGQMTAEASSAPAVYENGPGETDVAAAESGNAEMTAPALQRANGAVIIRRGDSLWRISRRVYGRGVRYSTIYLANQDQISDPDRIWPGQVFAVPRETSEGETADMEAIGDQAVTRDGQPVAQ